MTEKDALFMERSLAFVSAWLQGRLTTNGIPNDGPIPDGTSDELRDMRFHLDHVREALKEIGKSIGEPH